MAASGRRFVTFNKAEYANLLNKKVSKNTESKTAVTLFNTFCEETGNLFEEENVTSKELYTLVPLIFVHL